MAIQFADFDMDGQSTEKMSEGAGISRPRHKKWDGVEERGTAI
jgi:hypothetical protein